MNSLAPEATRRIVDEKQNVGELCLAALEEMMHEKTEEDVITVLHAGSMYFFHVKCVGFKPPYELMAGVNPDDSHWMGQRAS